MTFPHLAPTGEIQQIEKTLKCTQIINTDDFNQTSKGLLIMRLHFLVTSYIDLYLWCPQTKQVVLGNPDLTGASRNVAHKKSHIMTIDKAVAEMHVGDTMLETSDQMQDRVIKHYLRDESLLISNFDSFMPLGNQILPFEKPQDFTD